MDPPAATSSTDLGGSPILPPQPFPLFRVGRYLLRRILAILLTILLGVFATVVIANRGGMLDQTIRERIAREILQLRLDPTFEGDLDIERSRMAAAEGLSLPFWPRHLRYTLKALALDWGDVLDRRKFGLYVEAGATEVKLTASREIILSRLPNTLLLSGIAYLILLLVGIPLALFLSQREGSWLDRVTAVLTPLSSVPSWVLGVLLVLVFAVELKLLPAGKMYDALPPQSLVEKIAVVALHLILPVTAIVLSLVFQWVYNWRTYLLIHSQENYVILARAKGLTPGMIESRYILRPGLPYILTSLLLTLVGFWQTITALEFYFQWPGIGKLYVDALPNFLGERMYAGEMSIVLGIVVLFAYLLGTAVFLLDFLYLLVDPRLQLEERNTAYRPVKLPKTGPQKSGPQKSGPQKSGLGLSGKRPFRSPQARLGLAQPVHPQTAFSFGAEIRQTLREALAAGGSAFYEIRRVPAALTGLVLAGLLVLASILIAIVIPYDPVGKNWTESNLTGRPTHAKLALPAWVNWFRVEKLPPTILLDSQAGTAWKWLSWDAAAPGVQIEFGFDYPYREFPSDMALYVAAEYAESAPFLSLLWITPDGREIKLKDAAVVNDFTYSFAENVTVSRELLKNPGFKQWFIRSGNDQTPAFYLLFADPKAADPVVVPGRYVLRAEGILFDPQSDLDLQLIVFGLVEGWGGTDHLRRDLLVPLLWGLPFALLIGVVGAVATTLVSLVLSAAAAWMGGWVDGLIQRATEANLILPVLAVAVLLFAYYQLNLWLILGLIILSNVLGSSTKVFRAAFLQVKQAEYIEAAKTYGASDWRIITHYLVPRILPVILPQIVILIPNFIFLEATLAIFNVSDPRYPTWGRVIYSALRYGASFGSRYWVLEPIALMLLTGLAFVLISFAFNRMLNPLLNDK